MIDDERSQGGNVFITKGSFWSCGVGGVGCFSALLGCCEGILFVLEREVRVCLRVREIDALLPVSVHSTGLTPAFSPSPLAKDGWLLSPRRIYLHATATYLGIFFPFSSIYAFSGRLCSIISLSPPRRIVPFPF
ncbi:hypothetical protein DY000_02050507 [Brassica cretica]|uniref:Uncharacterized protein n=1 Tax=Brassica cretica TaxID=69181 RepID=A0ABQ7F731_BRACR|nr:hypothetical protein DY000_02050507 [Brassica cretica]